MLLIADCGSTKCSWSGNRDQQPVLARTSPGFNPFLHSPDQMEQFVRESFGDDTENQQVETIRFYGAGCSTAQNNQHVTEALHRVFPQAKIVVEHDMLAAARATCGRSPGMVAILGTGSNSCWYDGEKIAGNVPSLGYLLSDEGSGNHLGKLLVRAYLLNELPAELHQAFETRFADHTEGLLQRVYEHERPNAYLASFAPFYNEHSSDFLDQLARESFGTFVDSTLVRYNKPDYPVHIVGSIGHYFQTTIREVLADRQLKAGQFMQDPLEGLIQFHRSES